MSLRGHSIWVVGAGFLGAALAEACRREGARVLTIDPDAVATLRGSAGDSALLQHALERLVPDVVFCCTATHGGTEEEYRKAYLEPASQLTCWLQGTRIVFCSSVSVYEGRGGELITEESPARAETPRARILLQAEDVVLKHGGVVARLAPLYNHERCELIRRFACGLPQLPGHGGRLMNYLHVDDAVDALLLLCAEPWLSDGLFNVSGECFAKADIYARLEKIFGIEAEPESAEPSVRGCSDMRVDCSRIRELGWEPICTIEELAQEWKR